MIDWVHQYSIAWGADTRRMYGTSEEGFPTMDAIERARQGMLSAGTGTVKQFFPEHRRDESLAIARALAKTPIAPIHVQACMWASYVVRVKADFRAETLTDYFRTSACRASPYFERKMSKNDYYDLLDRVHWYLVGRIDNVPQLQQERS